MSSEPQETVCALHAVTKSYAMGDMGVQALKGVSLTVQRGDFVAIMGASGSGKSTFMNILGLLDRMTSGTYALLGKDVSHMGANARARLRGEILGFVFQGFNLLSRTSAAENVELPLLYHRITQAERRRRALASLAHVGLADRAHHTPSQLSGGQQQRVAIARALVGNPQILLADEPTGNLDSHTSDDVMSLLRGLNDAGLTIVLVTHEPDIALYAKRKVVFKDGLILSDDMNSTQTRQGAP